MLTTLLLLSATTLYQTIAVMRENQQQPPGQLVDVGGHRLHYCLLGEGDYTFIVDHSLGGVDGYALIEELAKLGRVCIYDRAGYGWSDRSPARRTSAQIVTELETLLTQANIAPPYILIGNSFGSYNMRLYAHRFPGKVKGMILTDGLHESGMLHMSLPVKLFKYVILWGLLWCVLGASFGIIRLCNLCSIFELVKPQLRQVAPDRLAAMKRSFCRPKHWITMIQEVWSIDISGRQLRVAAHFGDLPIVTIKASSFFLPSIWTKLFPRRSVDRLRDQIHEELLKLSTQCSLQPASRSGHFVWIDQPEVVIDAVKTVLQRC